MTTWRIPPESIQEFVGPLTVTANGTPTTAYKLAVVEYGSRPTTWEDPVLHPDNAVAGLGVIVGVGSSHLLVAGHAYLIWVQIDLGVSEPVLDDVGLILAI
jgi:hypothetical protein